MPPKIVVLGDVALDVWMMGAPQRLAQEAPCILHEMATPPEYSPGMASNVARVLAVNYHPVFLCAELGTDAYGDTLDQLLQAVGVQRRSYLRAGETLLRIRTGRREPDGTPVISGRWDYNPATSREAVYSAPLDWTGVAALVVSGYGRGALERLGWLLEGCPKEVLVVVDIKTPPLIPLPCHVDYATPNAAEYADAVARVQRRRSARRPARPVDVLHALAGRTTAFARYRRLGAVVVTQGASGAVYNSCGTPIPQPVWVRPGDATPGRYTCGAGDVFVAKFTSELVQGFSLHHAVQAAVDTASHAARTGCFCWS